VRALFFIAALISHNNVFAIDKKIMKPINKYCQGIKKEVVLGIIRIESNFKNTSVNPENGIGYMQVRLKTARWIKCGARKNRDLKIAWMNVKCGCEYLRQSLERFDGDYSKAIAAYNAGSAINCKTGRLRSGKKCSIGKLINQEYVSRVLGYAEGFRCET
jgi:soluble lytic murein transglycosylase-like protein